MEPTDNTDTCQPARLKVTESRINDLQRNKEERTEPAESMKKLELKPPASPTSFLARNAVLVPSQVARLKEITPVSSGLQVFNSPTPVTSSGSATVAQTVASFLVSVDETERRVGGWKRKALRARLLWSSNVGGNPRNKTALAPGHSLMDWIRLGSSGVDLTGVGGVSRNITLKELAKHNERNDAWIAIRGIVFNVTRYMDFHPGGVPELMRGIGKDATKLFDDVHAWVNYQSILQKCVVGRLMRGAGNETFDAPDKSITAGKNQLSLIAPMAVSSNETEGKPEIDQTKIISVASKIQVDWKQTTNSLSFIYKPSQEQQSTAYRLTKINASELIVKIYFGNTVIRHDYDLNGNVSWPPTCNKNFENSEIEFTFTKSTGKLWESYGSRSLGRDSKANDRIYKEYKIVNNTVLCEGVHLLVVKSDDYMEIVPIGRHVEAKLKVMGMEVSRFYTPVPPSLHPEYIAADYRSDCLCLMIKRYDDGALSPSITALKPGQIMTLSNSLGSFVVESFDDCPTIHMLAAGTGLTPMLGIIQRALCRRNVLSINLVNFNRNEDNIFYRSQLDRVCADKKLKVVDVLSQPKESWTDRRGLASRATLEELVGTSTKHTCIFTCGPTAFMTVVREVLTELQWKPSQIHEFSSS